MAAKLPWVKWYWSAWLTEPSVLMCSRVSRSIWVDMLGLMSLSERVGYLEIKGNPMSPEQLAVMLREHPDVVKQSLAELEQNGVFSRTGKGVIYCRRQVRDDKISASQRVFGKLGGNPSLLKDKGKSHRVNPRDNPRLKIEIEEEIDIEEDTGGNRQPPTTNLAIQSCEQTLPVGAALVPSAPQTRGTRLPADWPLTDELATIAGQARELAKLPPIDIETEHAKFCDFWHAKAGAGAAKRDWVATWRNWCRNARGSNGHTGPEAFGASMRKSIADVVSMFDTEPKAIGGTPCLKLIQK